MAAVLTLDDVRKAWDARDPRLITLIEQLCTQPVPAPETPIRDGALTFDKFLYQLRDYRYRQKSKEEQAHYRTETLKALEDPKAEVPLADKLKVHEVIFALWESNDGLARDYLLRIIARVPLVYGPWKAIKKIFKESEAKNDTEIYGAIAARLDMAHAGAAYGKQVSGATIAYCVRRAWRYLRRVGLHLPATYPDVACEFLVNYTDGVRLNGSWVFNHILYHDSKKYGRSNFRFGWNDKTADPTNLKNRAYGDTWKRSHRPLFSLLERAKCDAVRDYATTALKTDFRQVLRDTEPSWVVRLVAVPSRAIHDFVVWLLQNVPKFEQSAFRTLGLHDAVLKLFDSPSADARKYAANYARTHAICPSANSSNSRTTTTTTCGSSLATFSARKTRELVWVSTRGVSCSKPITDTSSRRSRSPSTSARRNSHPNGFRAGCFRTATPRSSSRRSCCRRFTTSRNSARRSSRRCFRS